MLQKNYADSPEFTIVKTNVIIIHNSSWLRNRHIASQHGTLRLVAPIRTYWLQDHRFLYLRDVEIAFHF